MDEDEEDTPGSFEENALHQHGRRNLADLSTPPQSVEMTSV